MAQFMSGCQGNRGSETRLGSKASGAMGWAQGWNIGGQVYASFRDDRKCDEVKFQMTGGTNGAAYRYGFYFERESNGNGDYKITNMDEGFIALVKEYCKRNDITLD